jgi:hypothetical protein
MECIIEKIPTTAVFNCFAEQVFFALYEAEGVEVYGEVVGDVVRGHGGIIVEVWEIKNHAVACMAGNRTEFKC